MDKKRTAWNKGMKGYSAAKKRWAGHMLDKKCLTCGGNFKVKKSSVDRGYGKFCSRKCCGVSFRGREGYNKGGSYPQMQGRKFTEEHRKKISEAKKGANAPFWRGGISLVNRPLRNNISSTFEYSNWRKKVFERDGYKCVICSAKGVKIQADHIQAFAMILKKHGIQSVEAALMCSDLWDISNGRTLCVPCHKKTPTYGVKALTNQY